MVHYDALHEEIGEWGQSWLINDSPPYTAYLALNGVCGLVADKEPRVRPLVCGEIWIRLVQACNQTQTKSSAKVSCGVEQLCAGLEYDIEGSLCATREVWPEAD